MHSAILYATGTAMSVLSTVSSVPTIDDAYQNFRVNREVTGAYFASASSEDEADFAAATLAMQEPDAGTWDEIKVQLGL